MSGMSRSFFSKFDVSRAVYDRNPCIDNDLLVPKRSGTSLGQTWDKLGQLAGVFHRCRRLGTKILPSGRQKEYALVPEPNVFAIIRVPPGRVRIL